MARDTQCRCADLRRTDGQTSPGRAMPYYVVCHARCDAMRHLNSLESGIGEHELFRHFFCDYLEEELSQKWHCGDGNELEYGHIE